MYKPDQRRVWSRVLTINGWIEGHFHVPSRGTLVAALNRPGDFLPFTGVTMDDEDGRIDFLALQRQSMVLVVPEPEDVDEHPDTSAVSYESERVTFLLPWATVAGEIRILSGLRVSDVLSNSPPFLHASDCQVRVTRAWKTALEQEFPHVMVNIGHAMGVAEFQHAELPVGCGV